MREIVLDTETTGLDAADGHRIVELGAVELVNLLPTGRVYHQYVNPERPVPREAVDVHGLTDAFLADKPVFAAVAPAFLDFLGDARLVIHNAAFDLAMLNAELGRLGAPPLGADRALDTLEIARGRFPGAPASLDALCRRFGIDNSGREKHGALLDSELLAEVYLELMGGRQAGLELAAETAAEGEGERSATVRTGLAEAAAARPVRPPRPHAPSAEEEQAHRAFLEKLSAPIWQR